MKTWDNTDKSAWGEGPWQDEPDKAQWVAHGLDCLIVRGPSGALCGYVGVPPDHPYFEKPYSDVDGLRVHGGLTFANHSANTDDESRHICHVEQGAANKHVWWLGFDCGHCDDKCPSYAMHFPQDWGVYREFQYVVEQTESLAEQLTKVA